MKRVSSYFCLIGLLACSHLAEARLGDEDPHTDNGLEDEAPSEFELQARTEFLSMLRNNYGRNDFELEGDALSIITNALGKGANWEVEMVIGAELIPTLVESLSRQKGALRDQTLDALRMMSEKKSSFGQFQESEVLPSLLKVARSTLKPGTLLNVGHIAFNYFRNAYLRKNPTAPPMRDVRDIMSISRIMAGTGDKKLLETVSRFTEVISKVGGVDVELRTSGILPLISRGEDGKVVDPQQPKDEQGDAPNKPHPEETETEGRLDGSQVLPAIKGIVAKKDRKTLKERTFERVTSSMMERLDDGAEQLFEEKLLEMEELAPFLLLCLKPENGFAVHLAGIRVINLVMVEGTDAQREALIMSEVLPALTALLPRGNEEVSNKALTIIKLMCKRAGTATKAVDQLRKTDILTSLIKLTKEPKKPSSLSDIAGILYAFSTGNRGLPPDAGEGASPETKKKMEEQKLTSWKKLLPPAEAADDIFTLSKLLFKARNDEITKQVLMSLLALTQVEGNVYQTVILASGILPAVLPHISHPDKDLRILSAALIMGAAAGGSGPTSRLRYYEVFKNLEGTQGMKDFYKLVRSVDPEKDRGFALAVEVFLQRLKQALSKETPTEIGVMGSKLTDAVLKSGFAYSIVKLMKKESPKQFRKLAGTILFGLTTGVEEYQATYLLAAEVVPLLVGLLNYDSDPHSEQGSNGVMAATATSIGMLARIHPEARDELISAGAVPKLFHLIQNPVSNLEMDTGFLFALCMIMGRKPIAPVELFGELPGSLRHVITKHSLRKIGQHDEKKMQGQLLVVQRVCQCIRDFAEYGPDQVEQLEDEGLFKDLVNFLRITEPNSQKAALQAVKRICTKKPGSRDSFVKLGIAKVLPRILQSPSSPQDSKKIAGWLMLDVFTEHFTHKQKVAAKAEYEK